ncbi:hypothetical protein D347_00401 [Enterococcus faecalis LA3B-2]|nr:hypothetical protein D347_00401 [Enterococcus faecalis LA3B-2]
MLIQKHFSVKAAYEKKIQTKKIPEKISNDLNQCHPNGKIDYLNNHHFLTLKTEIL